MLDNDINTVPFAVPTGTGPGSSCVDAGSWLGSYLCDPSPVNGWMSALSYMLWRWLQAWWPLLVVVAVVALAVGAVLALVVRRARRYAVESARWVEIIPPASMPRDGAAALWHALAGMLHRTRRRGLAPRQLAVEFVADADRVRAGLWVPPALPVGPVADAITHVWPGARVRTDAMPPVWTVAADTARRGRVSAVEIYPQGGPWVPLVEPARVARPVEVGTADPLRAVLAALAHLDPGQRACVQLVVTPERGLMGGRDRSWWARGLLAVLALPLRALLAVVDLFLPGPSGANAPKVRPHAGERAEEDPAGEARRKSIAVKQGHGPHLRVTLRVAYAGPGPRRAHRRALDVLVGAFDLAAPLASLRTHTTRRAAARLDGRRPARARHGFAATVGELAALWHLPEEPTQYGMADTTARVRPPSRALPRTHRSHRPPTETKGTRDEAA